MHQKGLRNGKGRLDAANGDIIEANFGYNLTHKSSRLRHNPFAQGLPQGNHVKVTFSDGGIYEGAMLDGQVTGEGRYTSALGEVYQGTFKDGNLHGQGRFISAYDETFEGEWKDGRLHGYGTWKGQTKEEYRGSFHLGDKWGRGVERYRGGNFYKGFFREDYRTGRGTLCYGHVQGKAPRAAGLPKEILYDCRMDCDWLAGYMRSGGVNYYMKSNTSFYTFNRESLWYPYVSQLKERQDARLRSTNRLRKRHSFMLNHVRESLEKAKRDSFKHCLRLAGLFIKKEALQGKGGLAQQMRRGVDRVMDERQGYYEHAVRHGYIEKDDEQVLANLELPKKVKELERVARKEGYELRVGTEEEKEEEAGEGGGEGPSVLSALLQLVFEGAEERWRVFGSARCMKIRMRQAELEADKVGMCGEGEGGEGGGGKGGVNLASAAPLPLKGWLGSSGAPLLQGKVVDVTGSRRRKKKSGSNRTKIPTYGEGANSAIGLPFKQIDQD